MEAQKQSGFFEANRVHSQQKKQRPQMQGGLLTTASMGSNQSVTQVSPTSPNIYQQQLLQHLAQQQPQQMKQQQQANKGRKTNPNASQAAALAAVTMHLAQQQQLNVAINSNNIGEFS